MSVVADILKSYRSPKAVALARLERATEPAALATLIAGCLILFIAQWPRLGRAAHFDPSIPLDARISGAIMGIMFVLPLFMYVLAGLVFLLFRLIKIETTGLFVRTALFWSLLAGAPLWLMHGFFSGYLGSSGLVSAMGLVLLAAYLFVLVGCLRTAVVEDVERQTGDA